MAGWYDNSDAWSKLKIDPNAAGAMGQAVADVGNNLTRLGQYNEQMRYRKQQDAQQNDQWQKNFDQQAQLNRFNQNMAERNANDAAFNADRQHALQLGDFNYRQTQDSKNFEYKKGRDTVEDNQWNQTFKYKAKQDNITNNQRQQQINFERQKTKAPSYTRVVDANGNYAFIAPNGVPITTSVRAPQGTTQIKAAEERRANDAMRQDTLALLDNWVKPDGKGGYYPTNAVKRVSGWRGNIGTLPGSVGRDTKVAFNQLVDSLAATNLDKLKGPMSDKDIAFLKSLSSGLETGMSQDAIFNRLAQIRRTLEGGGSGETRNITVSY